MAVSLYPRFLLPRRPSPHTAEGYPQSIRSPFRRPLFSFLFPASLSRFDDIIEAKKAQRSGPGPFFERKE